MQPYLTLVLNLSSCMMMNDDSEDGEDEVDNDEDDFTEDKKWKLKTQNTTCLADFPPKSLIKTIFCRVIRKCFQQRIIIYLNIPKNPH